MISMISEEGRAKVGIYEYVIDTADELENVPTDVHAGSIVYCIENSKKYMLNNSGTYVEVNFKKGGSGGEAKLGTKDISENGVYKASEFDLDGWSQVDVDVPIGVFPSGTSSIASNGIYDITDFASVDVNVAGGGGGGGDITADQVAMRTISGVVSGSATSIGSYAFYRCTALTTASFPNATSIGSNAFYFCSALTTASFPNVTSIAASAFYSCNALTTASFPNVTSIGSNAFYFCSALSTASFPNATSIGSSAFYYCTALTTANFPSATNIGNSAFLFCKSLTTVSFPNVTDIASSAFCSCTALTTASFQSVKTIGYTAFRYCSALMSAYFLASSVATIGNSVFLNTPMADSTYTGSFGSIYVPASLVSDYKAATNWSAYADRITSYVE